MSISREVGYYTLKNPTQGPPLFPLSLRKVLEECTFEPDFSINLNNLHPEDMYMNVFHTPPPPGQHIQSTEWWFWRDEDNREFPEWWKNPGDVDVSLLVNLS